MFYMYMFKMYPVFDLGILFFIYIFVLQINNCAKVILG